MQCNEFAFFYSVLNLKTYLHSVNDIAYTDVCIFAFVFVKKR